MKRIKIIPIIALLFFTSGAVISQNIDTDRMDRDLKIMESVMGEMFSNASAKLPFGLMFTFTSPSINTKSLYLSGYGVVLEYNNLGRPYVLKIIDADGDDKKDSTGEETEQYIKEFLRNYAVNIGQLHDSDKITLVYTYNSDKTVEISASRSDSVTKGYPYYFNLNNMNPSDIKSITILNKEDKFTDSYSVTVKDLQAFKAGKISENELNKRIEKNTIDKTENVDVKVLASVLETLLDESNKGGFSSQAKVDYLNLAGLGILYNLNLNAFKTPMWRINFDDYTSGKGFSHADSSSNGALIFRGQRGRISGNVDVDNATKERDEKTKKEIDALVNTIKEYVLDIGKTLQSIAENESIIASLNINKTASSNLPNRIEIHAKKSDLTAHAQGKLSRAQALDKIKVTEY